MVEGDQITQGTHWPSHMHRGICAQDKIIPFLVTLECFKATERILRTYCNSRGSFFGEGSLDVSGVNFGKIMPGVVCALHPRFPADMTGKIGTDLLRWQHWWWPWDWRCVRNRVRQPGWASPQHLCYPPAKKVKKRKCQTTWGLDMKTRHNSTWFQSGKRAGWHLSWDSTKTLVISATAGTYLTWWSCRQFCPSWWHHTEKVGDCLVHFNDKCC